ncbi:MULTISPECIES: DUF3311 domain-containing protein [Methylobacterium]|uniref:Permease n=1 Tax=Methylobacterium jeotgali TaxID=381630 RepID=A0ABQ4SQ83_9HYPH|nr:MULTISPECIES: DUF3311 domain-containing protein [Methylobacterium]PIU07615.1 MAG: permease [Methylobacterium sp. CG09_land_8_20_14_0_10_71_15]PIU12939.1 MAG: permease [Methylobacterium sp. CG08_land_8_20_14_0_20_71_15]GBU15931.1 permease [Methylobacterium sp.]GJE05384.1 hypothetical protein AOPFMNJM_0684 [Methylobacterium jeotgali]
MHHLRWLALLPFLGMLVGPFFLNRVTPFVLGMPLLMAWLVFCVLGTSAVMGVIYLTDPANRTAGGTDSSGEGR